MSSSFATWLREQRTRHGLAVVGLAELSGVAPATISRLEHAQVEPTVLRALRLATALDVSPAQLAPALSGGQARTVRERRSAYAIDVQTFEQVEVWLEDTRSDWRRTSRGLAQSMNRVLSKLGTDVQPWKTSEVERLLDESPLNDCALHYPPQVSARLVQQLYRAGALLLPEDLGVYLRGQRGRRTQAQLARHSGLARAAISRIELGQLERSKLVDIIALDQALDAHGELLGMIWQARPLLERHWTPRELRLARLRLILDRWTRVLERRPASR